MRLKGHDYSQPGAYFVTVCVQHQRCLFGDALDGQMRLNAAGEMVWYWWYELKNKFPNIQLDEFIVMPNHAHGIIHIVSPVGDDTRVVPAAGESDDSQGEHIGSPLQNANLIGVMQWFKTMTTNAYIRGSNNRAGPLLISTSGNAIMTTLATTRNP